MVPPEMRLAPVACGCEQRGRPALVRFRHLSGIRPDRKFGKREPGPNACLPEAHVAADIFRKGPIPKMSLEIVSYFKRVIPSASN